MRRKSLRILALAFLGVWFGVVLPGHQRGFIAPPGCRAEARGSCDDCRGAEPTKSCHLPGQPKRSKAPASPGPDPARHCVVCFFVATLHTPPVTQIEAPRLGLIDLLPVTPAHRVAVTQVERTLGQRAPPCWA